jgi:hypothetical protein
MSHSAAVNSIEDADRLSAVAGVGGIRQL